MDSTDSEESVMNHSYSQEDDMGYQIPETLEGLDAEKLGELYEGAFEEYKTLAAKPDAEVTDEEIERIEALGVHLDAVTAEQGKLAEAAAERDAKLAAARERVTAAEAPEPEAEAADPEPAPEAEAEAEETPAEEPAEGDAADPEPTADAEAETIEEKEPVMASAQSSVEKALANSSQEPEVFAHTTPATSLIASGKSLPQMAVNEEFEDFTQLAEVFAKTASRGPSGDMSKFSVPNGRRWGLSSNHARNTFAKFQRSGRENVLDSRMSADEQMRLINEAGKSPEASVLAAGGWCAPSETMYDFCSYETVSGILDVPTITVNRGGINYSKGPSYADIAAGFGFQQTETEAEAGTEKVCYEVECPPFVEQRLEAIGFCITNGVLTDSAYPELTRRVLEIAAVAHAHAVNAYVIDQIVAAAGAAVDFTPVGAATADLLDALSMQAWRLRTSYAMGENAVIEVVLPSWAKAVVQSDLSRRTGVDMLAIGDAQINSYFSARNLRVQFVEDYQTLSDTSTGSWTAWPGSVEALLYPAGAFVKGTSDVIDLDTIYDSVGLSTNTYTAAFFEEGILVANRCAEAVAVSIDLCNSGQTGAADIACAVV